MREKLRKHKAALIVIPVFAALLLTAHQFLGSVCLIHAITGFPCPGCGLTRAAILAMQGRWQESLEMHPLFVPALAAGFFLIINLLILKKKPGKLFYCCIFIISGLFLAVYCYRMATLFPVIQPMTYNTQSLLSRIIKFLSGILTR